MRCGWASTSGTSAGAAATSRSTRRTTPKQPFTVDFLTCQAGRAKARVERQHRDDAEAQKLKPGWDDGRHYYVKPHEKKG